MSEPLSSRGRKRQLSFGTTDSENSSLLEQSSPCKKRLLDVSQVTGIPPSVSEAAAAVLANLVQLGFITGGEDAICLSLLYSCYLERSCQDDPQTEASDDKLITVSDFLSHSSLSVPEFLKAMQLLNDIHTSSPHVTQRIAALQRKFFIVSPLFAKFEKMFDDLFVAEEHLSTASSTSSFNVDSFSQRKERCWTLFVYAKDVLLTGNLNELVASFHLLLLCINYIMDITPVFLMKPPYDAFREDHSSRLAELCVAYDAKLEEVSSLEASFESILSSLPKTNNVFDLCHLRDSYRERYRHAGDIDELLFLTHNEHLLYAPDRSQNLNQNSTEAPVTPVSAALNTVQQLQALLSKSRDGPSEGLLAYFEECPNNPLVSIEERLEDMQQAFIGHFGEAADTCHTYIAKHRFSLARRLYFRVMEALLRMEERRLNERDFTHLLYSNLFHRSLLGCSLIVVLASYSRQRRVAPPEDLEFPRFAPEGHVQDDSTLLSQFSVETTVPWVLDLLHLHSYDFYKMIESFITGEPELSKVLVKHLQEVENRILSSIAWESDSPVYQALAVADRLQAGSDAVTNTESDTERQVKISTPLSPSTVRALQGGTPSPRSSNQQRSQSLNIFFKKVSGLAYLRLVKLCSHLDIPSDLQLKAWSVLEHCLTQFWTLMKDRHIDQMMMCAVYAVCRIQDKEIKFRRIVSVYSTLPHACNEIYKHVRIQRNEYSSIITFYNNVFMPTLKPFIIRFADPKRTPTMSPGLQNMTSPIPSSTVYKLPGRKNFFISPMKDSPFKSPLTPSKMTPRTRQLYSFGEGLGSAEKLKQINESVRLAWQMASPMSSNSIMCLNFDQPQETTGSSESSNIIKVKRCPPAGVHSRKSLKFDSDPVSEQPGSMNGTGEEKPFSPAKASVKNSSSSSPRCAVVEASPGVKR